MKNYPSFPTKAFTVAFLLAGSMAAQAQAQAETPVAAQAPVEAQTHDESQAHDHAHDHTHSATEKTRTPQKKPSKADLLWLEAEKAWHDGDYEKNIKINLEVIKLEPDNAQAYGNAAFLMWSMGRGSEAEALIRQSVKRNPNSWEILFGAAQQFYLQKSDPKATYVFYERALALKPKGHNRWLNLRSLAFAAEKVGKRERAIQVWKRILVENPNDANAKRLLDKLQAPAVTTSQSSS